MKKILIIFLGLLLIACNKETINEGINEVPETVIETSEVLSIHVGSLNKQVSENITVTIDPKIELTYLIAHMLSEETGYQVYFEASQYVTDQLETFDQYRHHEVFNQLKDMINQGFTYDAISGVLHYYDDDLKLKDNLIVDQDLLTRAGGQDKVEDYLAALADFRLVSNYDAYFLENESYYDILLNRAKTHVEKSGMEEVYLSYYGESLGPINIVITPVCPMGFGNKVVFQDKTILMPTLDVSIKEQNYIAFLLHEISHPYVNPETSLRLETVNDLESLLEPIKESMASQAYNSWETCLNEHVVRANVIMMLEEIYGALAREKRLYYEKGKDYIYIDNILASLEAYRQSRETYPVFSIYYDVIIENLKSEL